MLGYLIQETTGLGLLRVGYSNGSVIMKPIYIQSKVVRWPALSSSSFGKPYISRRHGGHRTHVGYPQRLEEESAVSSFDVLDRGHYRLPRHARCAVTILRTSGEPSA